MDPKSPEYRREATRASAMVDQLSADLREEFAKLSTTLLVGSLLIMSQANSPQELLLMILNRTDPTLQGVAGMSVMVAFANAIQSRLNNPDNPE
jgi:hypothetical protein